MSALIFFFFLGKKRLHHQMPAPDLDFKDTTQKKLITQAQ